MEESSADDSDGDKVGNKGNIEYFVDCEVDQCFNRMYHVSESDSDRSTGNTTGKYTRDW